MKTVILSLICLLAPHAHADGGKWEEVLLFDWVYPGESSYADLKAAANQVGSSDWVSQRLQAGEKVPQASARELAWTLSKDPRVDQGLQSKLKSDFADEAAMMKETGDRDLASEVGAVAAQFDAMSRQMDDIDATFKRNTYGKGETPSSTLQVATGYRLNNASGILQGETHNYLEGGINFILNGTLDKATYTFSMGGIYWNNDESYQESVRSFQSNADLNFVFPLFGSGLVVNLSQVNTVFLSNLLFSTITLTGRDLYAVDLDTTGVFYWVPGTLQELNMNYPAAVKSVSGLNIQTQGSSAWWPFTSTNFLFGPESDFWEQYTTAKFVYTGLRLEEDLGPKGRFLDDLLFFGVGLNANRDAGLLLGAAISNLAPQTVNSYSVGVKAQLSSGSSLNFEYSGTNVSAQNNPGQPVYNVNEGDNAYLGTVVQPVGPFNIGLEAGMAGKDFLTGGLPDWGGVAVVPLASAQTGSVLSTTVQDPFTSTELDSTPATAKQFPNNLVQITDLSEATLLSSNTSRYAAKGQWTGSWISLGLYDGTITQLTPSSAFVMTTPYIEGRTYNGYGWFQMIGQSYADPPAPDTPVSPASAPPAPGPVQSNTGVRDQGLFNQPDDGYAIDPAKSSAPLAVHWNYIGQHMYREAEYTVLLSEHGVGDNHVMPDSIKDINYAGGTLKLDFKSLFSRQRPMEFDIIGEDKDVAPQSGLPAFDAKNFFNQQYYVGFFDMGLTDKVDFLATSGYETWRTDQSYFPVFVQVKEFGAGFDLNLDQYLTGLKLHFRSTWTNLEDLMQGQRQFSFYTLGIGTLLNY
jgi:hypothetical protein